MPIKQEDRRFMLSKNRIKYIHSLELKKNRKATGEFIGEGPKLTSELLKAFECTYIAGTEKWQSDHSQLLRELKLKGISTDIVSEEELKRASLLQHPQEVIAIFRQPSYSIDLANVGKDALCLALDGVQDPGNLGTIVRIADWFGIEDIFCSQATADIYNPKSVQATMGSMARVRVHYTNLQELVAGMPGDTPVYGTLLDGNNLYEEQLSNNGLLIMGNEGKGITPELRKLLTHRLLLPNYPQGRETAESLNVGVATAIICAEFRRRSR